MDTVIDSINITLADSFVVSENKIEFGHGEAKLYVGQRTSDSVRDFFGPTGFQLRCRLLKSELKRFMQEMRVEYLNPSYEYRAKARMAQLWIERMRRIEALNEDILYFNVREQTQLEGPRVYVNSRDGAYNLIRELPLPNRSRLTIVKIDTDTGIVFDFRLLPDFDGYTNRPVEAELESILEAAILEDEELAPAATTVERVYKARVGQQKFKRKVLVQCQSICAFTHVQDESLLVAGHIKPWARSNDVEKLDPQNGLVFTPTYDKLFNNGFISFTDDRALILSPLLSRDTATKLHLFQNMVVPIPLLGAENRSRREYMAFHRDEILRR